MRERRVPFVERAYVRLRGCLSVGLVVTIIALVLVGGLIGYLAFQKPDMVRHFASIVRDRVSSFFFPPIEEFLKLPEPRVYLQSPRPGICGRDYTPSLPALHEVFVPGEVQAWESERNILDNMVRFSSDGADFCSGLLLTTDGFVLTAHHCIDKYEPAWTANLQVMSLRRENDGLMQELRSVRIHNRYGGVFSLDAGFLATYPIYDLAVVKAEVPESGSRAVRFHMALEDPGIADPVRLLAFEEGTLMIYEGNVIVPTLGSNYIDNTGAQMDPRVMEDILFTDVYIEEGFSGGVLINASGELMGTNAWGTNFGISQEDIASGHAKARHIDTLVRRVYDDLHLTDASECAAGSWEAL
ncbi:MAG: trypsin-like serine protease [Deltaproteobacteria bacterium]|nr:trypsin-like serine protease [Deltaproteobacteria bacterium]